MRGWHELVATVGDLVWGGVPGLGLILLTVTVLVALLWYWWPEWWLALRRALRSLTAVVGRAAGRIGAGFASLGRPRRLWGRLRFAWSRWRLRWRWRRRKGGPDPDGDHADLPPDELPELPAAALVLSADELAAQGRYKEAVRERLRAIVRELVERGVLEYRPGWTVTELARMAGQSRPATARPLDAASEVFSRIWYGQQDALASHDAAMREYAAQVRAALAEQQVAAA
jgi:hypothetical protein